MKQMTVTIGEKEHAVSPLLYGLFLEDINFSCDGGLNTNMVINHSFDGVYIDPSYDMMDAILTKKAPDIYPDRLRCWDFENGNITSSSEDPASEQNPWYARLDISSHAVLTNKGYQKNLSDKTEGAISIQENHDYELSVYLRNINFSGTITVSIMNNTGHFLTEIKTLEQETTWTKHTIQLKGTTSGHGFLQIDFSGKGIIDLDCVIFSDTDYWGKENEKWSGGHFRKDMIQALKDLNPRFLRFPGGCIVEGAYPGNEYSWKNTVGPLIDRKPQVNLWAASSEDKCYCQSFQIGFYEYFLLCEDLGLEPLPTVWAGLNCQFRSNETIDTTSPEFYEKVVLNALDLIEYANGDPAISKWAKIRADSGHPEPFNMKMIGIGNENYGNDYHQKFELIKKEIQNKYPNMQCVMSSGAFPDGSDFENTWKVADEKFPDVYIDEHFYKSNEWFYDQVHRYDNYSRKGAKVFIGEYAANDLERPHKTNTFSSALSEAAFLTGVENNSDVVHMTSYAPLFAKSEKMQWAHNMIWFNSEHILKTPNYFVQQMFGSHIGNYTYSYEGSLPENIYLSVTADDNKFYLKAVNTGNVSADICIHFHEKIETNVHCTFMQSDDPDCVNELTFSGAPIYHVTPKTYELSGENNTLSATLLSNSINIFVINKS